MIFVKSVHCVRDTGRAVSRRTHWRICMSSAPCMFLSVATFHFGRAPLLLFFISALTLTALGNIEGRGGMGGRTRPARRLDCRDYATRLWLRVNASVSVSEEEGMVCVWSHLIRVGGLCGQTEPAIRSGRWKRANWSMCELRDRSPVALHFSFSQRLVVAGGA